MNPILAHESSKPAFVMYLLGKYSIWPLFQKVCQQFLDQSAGSPSLRLNFRTDPRPGRPAGNLAERPAPALDVKRLGSGGSRSQPPADCPGGSPQRPRAEPPRAGCAHRPPRRPHLRGHCRPQLRGGGHHQAAGKQHLPQAGREEQDQSHQEDIWFRGVGYFMRRDGCGSDKSP